MLHSHAHATDTLICTFHGHGMQRGVVEFGGYGPKPSRPSTQKCSFVHSSTPSMPSTWGGKYFSMTKNNPKVSGYAPSLRSNDVQDWLQERRGSSVCASSTYARFAARGTGQWMRLVSGEASGHCCTARTDSDIAWPPNAFRHWVKAALSSDQNSRLRLALKPGFSETVWSSTMHVLRTIGQ